MSRYILLRVMVCEEERIRSLGKGDLLILGGGPIMDDPDLAKWAAWFDWARRCGARTAIAGCGIGPLRHPKAFALARTLLAQSDVSLIRNTRAPSWTARGARGWPMALDPAFLCAPLLSSLAAAVTKRPWLAVNARAVGIDSVAGGAVALETVIECVVGHVGSLERWARIDGVVPFSTCELGVDPDSVFAGRAAATIGRQWQVPVDPLPPTTVMGLVNALLPCDYVLSIRMHGFIIALMLGCRAANLDYIGGGGKGQEFYRDWLGRSRAPRLLEPGSLREEDFVTLVDLSTSLDGLLETYVGALRQALAC